MRPAAEPGLLQGRIGSSVGEALSARTTLGRHLAVYDPKTKQLTHISTCFSTHHLMFAEDANNTLWTSGGGPVVGWLNTKMFDETHDEAKSQGWTALIIDTNGNGKRDDYVEPNQPVDPAKDKRFGGGFYCGGAGARRIGLGHRCSGCRARSCAWSPGSNPPETALAEVYEPPFNDPINPGFSPRGSDVDRNGVYWAALASGHLASFDRRKCKGPLNGPTATGQHCPEGWTLYPEPLPQLKGVTDPGSAGASYYTWVDQFDIARPRRQHADQHRQRRRSAARAEGRQVGRDARALSARATTRNGWTAASTIPRPDGRAAASGRPSARARRSTWKPARGRRAK